MIGLICRPVVMASYNISSALSDPFSANLSIQLFLLLIKMMEHISKAFQVNTACAI